MSTSEPTPAANPDPTVESTPPFPDASADTISDSSAEQGSSKQGRTKVETPRWVTAMDEAGRIRLTHSGALVAALFRIGLGLIYLWAFIAQGFGLSYSNTNGNATNPTYGWHFSYDAGNGWITSGFDTSPSAGFINGMHGPLADTVQDLPTGLTDFLWIFAIGGLGIALTLGIFMGIAGWGGFVLNLVIWLTTFPPSNNPIIDGEHMAFAFGILLCMYIQAGNYLGLGRWWRRHVPRLLA